MNRHMWATLIALVCVIAGIGWLACRSDDVTSAKFDPVIVRATLDEQEYDFPEYPEQDGGCTWWSPTNDVTCDGQSLALNTFLHLVETCQCNADADLYQQSNGTWVIGCAIPGQGGMWGDC